MLRILEKLLPYEFSEKKKKAPSFDGIPQTTFEASYLPKEDAFIHNFKILLSNFAVYSFTSFILKLIRPILSFPRHTTFTTSPSVRTSSTRLMRSLEIFEM